MKRRGLFWLQVVITSLTALFMIVPVVLSMLAGVTQNYFTGLHSGLTLKWVEQVWQMYADTFWLSLLIALSCLAVTVIAGVPAAWGLLKSPSRWASRIEECLMLPVALPGLATALGIILLYGQFSALRDSWLFILIGHVLFTLPFMIRPVLSVMQAIDLPRLEEAAASLGAGFWRRFFTVVVPNCRNGILAGAFMVITLSVGGVQHYLDAAHATDQNPAGRSGRQLHLDAAGSRVRLYPDLYYDDFTAAAVAQRL
ncbi:Putrescine transport system permease protein PotH [Pantoea agglomerans]|uniref:Putrescine transport system permease protein PotH n=1 Tax=Enterobacter agglomerans TaxID=549 RepID=A0A379ACF4_ENTAG|nr:Putrescine transport system permease protein PotH [Pantoea agglomerans]